MEGTMRRKERAMDKGEVVEFLEKCDVGRLGTCVDNRPYITPVHYTYSGGCVYFHCALVGHKIDNIKSNENVCFEVDEMMSIIKDENPCEMSTNYRSVVIFGKASVVENEDEKLEALRMIVEKHSEDKSVALRLQKKNLASTLLVKIVPDIITGKKLIK